MPKPKLFNLNEFLTENIQYPKHLREQNIEGRVLVRFVVDIDGYVIDVESISPEAHKDLQREAMRVVSEMPKWKPGMQGGKPVMVYYTLPIAFKLK